MIFDRITDPAIWDTYYHYKVEGHHLNRYEEQDLASFIEHREYLPVAEGILAGEGIGIPVKKQIRKMQTDKKRTVYLFSREENYLLKLITFLMVRKYDHIFSDNLYSFRIHTGVSRALQKLIHTADIREKYVYKVDISNYFNSIPVEAMLVRMKAILQDDPALLDFFTNVLRDRRVLVENEIIEEDKGVMAGTPFAVFFANMYLMEMDQTFSHEDEFSDVIYARYSDDIIIFADTEEGRDTAAARIEEVMKENGLSVNDKKRHFYGPGEAWTFLGICYENGVVDVSPVSLEKLKAKIRRKARAIKRWQIRKGITNEKAAKAFVRSMNRKFFEAENHETTWNRWYFPLINTDATLHVIDRYVQQWIRYLETGSHGKKAYRMTYEQMKEYGYQSLVNAWYAGRTDRQ